MKCILLTRKSCQKTLPSIVAINIYVYDCSFFIVRLWEQQGCSFQIILDPTQTPKQCMHQKRQALNDISSVYLILSKFELKDFPAKMIVSWRRLYYSSYGKNNSHTANFLKSYISLLLNTRFIQLFFISKHKCNFSSIIVIILMITFDQFTTNCSLQHGATH